MGKKITAFAGELVGIAVAAFVACYVGGWAFGWGIQYSTRDLIEEARRVRQEQQRPAPVPLVGLDA
jgi:uncharacterized protein (DUF697 family)